MLKGSLTQVKNSLATAFAPIVTVIAPLIQTLVNYITTACNALAMFFGALTGQKTVTIAKSGLGEIAAGAAGAADATGAANGAAEEYQRTLMGFDQINKLDDNSGSGGGSGGGGGGVGGAAGFTTSEIANTYSSWADKIKEAWDKADFTDIGAAISRKINQAMDMIDWDSIRKKCNKVATSIGTFINGFVAELDWGKVGYTLSQGFITALNMITTFLQTVNWQQIGRSVVQFFTGIDWAGLFSSASELLGSLAGAIGATIAGAVSVAWTSVKDYFGNKIEEAGGSIVKGVFTGIIDGLKNIGTWIKENIFDPFINGFKKAFGISSPSKEMKKMGGYIIDGLLQGLKNNKVTKFFSGMVKDIGKFFKNPVGSVKVAIDKGVDKAKTLWQSFKNDSVTKTLKESGSSAIKSARDVYNSIKNDTAVKTLQGNTQQSMKDTKWYSDNVYSKSATVSLYGSVSSAAER